MTPEEQTNRFYQHVWPHRAMVLRTARFLVRNAAEADDLAQEALMRAFRKIHQFDVASDPKAWLASILRHTRIDQTRLRGQTILTDADPLMDVPGKAVSYQAEVDSRQVLDLLERMSDQHLIEALQKIPEDIRWTLLLVDMEQMSYEEAAETMDVPLGTAKSRAHRGRQMLRHLLTSEPSDSTHKPVQHEERVTR